MQQFGEQVPPHVLQQCKERAIQVAKQRSGQYIAAQQQQQQQQQRDMVLAQMHGAGQMNGMGRMREARFIQSRT